MKNYTMSECIACFENVINRLVTYNGEMVQIDFGPHNEAIKAIREAREALSFMRAVDRGETNL